jgi:hypothetical protein
VSGGLEFPEMVTAEEAVRNYLTALHSPQLLRDEDRIDELSKKLADADDPIERLQLRSQLERASTVDSDQLEADFVTHAKAGPASTVCPRRCSRTKACRVRCSPRLGLLVVVDRRLAVLAYHASR